MCEFDETLLLLRRLLQAVTDQIALIPLGMLWNVLVSRSGALIAA